MRLILNLLWLVLAGLWMFLAYMIVGVLWCITIIGIPFGIASFRIGLFALWPFGRTVVKKPGAGAARGSAMSSGSSCRECGSRSAMPSPEPSCASPSSGSRSAWRTSS